MRELRVLVLNAGSSTLKWSVLTGTGEKSSAEGVVAWSALDAAARATVIARVVEAAGGVDAVGHRVVQGGERFRESVRITPEVREALGAFVALFPLHVPVALAGIDAVGAALPGTPQVACFDTSFHATLPAAATHFALPTEWTERLRLRRYGFHGLSVAWSVRRASELLGVPPARIIVCHLGSGCSVTAVRDGHSCDTSMGLTALDGLVMATRPGALDPGVMLALFADGRLSHAEIEHGLYERSGLLGLSGKSSAVSEILASARAGDPRATLAWDVYARSLRHAIGGAAAVLGGVDALVLTGGVAEHVAAARAEAVGALYFAGALLDRNANDALVGDGDVSVASSPIRVLVVHAREDRVVLAEVQRLLAPQDGGRAP